MNRLGLLTAISSSSLIVLAVACGGAKETDVFGVAPDSTETSPTDPTDTSNGATDTNPPSTSSSTTSSGGNNNTASSSSSSSSGGASGSSTSSTSSTSSSTSSSSSSSGGTKDGGTVTPTPVATLFCGTSGPSSSATCSPKNDVCCVYTDNGPGDYSCESKNPNPGDNCFGALAIECDDKTDCAGNQFCCGALDNDNGYTSVKCSATCASTTNVRAVIFCDPKAAVSQCPSGQTCGDSASLPGFHVCKS